MDSFTIASFGHLFMRVCLVGGLVFFMLAVGERAVGLNIKNVVNAIEKRATDGDVWPATALLIASILMLGYVLG